MRIILNEFLIKGNPCSNIKCENGGTCIIGTGNAPICTCLNGFYGSFCTLTSPCAANPCQNGGTCSNQITVSSGYFCLCPANYYGINCQVLLSNLTCFAPDTNGLLCQYWASLNYCSYQYMFNLIPIPIYCPASCKLCYQLPTCVDSQASCSFWAASTLCPMLDNINQNLCRKSCNNCQI